MFPIRDTVPSKNPPIATWLIILVNAIVFLLELGMPDAMIERFFYLFGVVPARYTHPQWALWIGLPIDDYWPFLTSMFLHGGWMHIIANMWTLWIFGDNVEDRMGPGRFVVFYLLCGLAAGIVHSILNPNSTVPAVGASGAIAGVMAAYFFMFPFARIVVLVPVFFFPFSSRCRLSRISAFGRSPRCSPACFRWRVLRTLEVLPFRPTSAAS